MTTPTNIDWKIYWDLKILWIREHRISWGKKKIYEKVKCKCGKEYFTRREHLMGGRINNCWCANVERMKVLWKKTTHGMESTSFYHIFQGIKSRCNYHRNASYKNYGWRGIKCEWNTFEEFMHDMLPWYKKWLSIDRIDVNWNYCKENCRWATKLEQWRNKRNNIVIEYKWEIMTLSQWEERWFWKRIIWDRMSRWWTFERALITPPQKKWKKDQ